MCIRDSQEAATKTIPKKRKCKKAKSLSNEALQIAEKGRETKRKGARESYRKLETYQLWPGRQVVVVASARPIILEGQ